MKNKNTQNNKAKANTKAKKQVEYSESSISDSEEKSKVSKVTDISFGITKKVKSLKNFSEAAFLKTQLREANDIKNGLFRDYDFSKLQRDIRLFIHHPRCGICFDFTNITEPSQVLFCSICEAVVHERCLMTIDDKYYSTKVIRRENCYFKGRYTSQINFGGLFICEKCNEEGNKNIACYFCLKYKDFMLKIKASKETHWAHNYCLLIYTKTNNASQCLHFNYKLEPFKVTLYVKKDAKKSCEICKNQWMVESLFKCAAKGCNLYYHISCAMRAMVILPLNILVSYFKFNKINESALCSTDVLFNSKNANFSKISIFCYEHNKAIAKLYCDYLTGIGDASKHKLSTETGNGTGNSCFSAYNKEILRSATPDRSKESDVSKIDLKSKRSSVSVSASRLDGSRLGLDDEDLKSPTPSKKVTVRKPITRNNSNSFTNTENKGFDTVKKSFANLSPKPNNIDSNKLNNIIPKAQVLSNTIQQNNIMPPISEQQSKDSFKQPNFVKHEYEERDEVSTHSLVYTSKFTGQKRFLPSYTMGKSMYDGSFLANEVMDSFYSFRGNLSRDIRSVKSTGASSLSISDFKDLKNLVLDIMKYYQDFDSDIKRLADLAGIKSYNEDQEN